MLGGEGSMGSGPGVIVVLSACVPLLAGVTAARAGGSTSEAVVGPVFSSTGPDAGVYGAAEGYPIGTRATASALATLVATYSHFDELYPSRAVPRAPADRK